MDCTARPVPEATLTHVRGCAADAADRLAVAAATPAGRIAAVDRFVRRWVAGDRPGGMAPADVPYLLGSLWGEAVVAALGWRWAEVVFRRHGDVPAVAVVSPDQSLALFPIHHVLTCLDDPAAAVTIGLAFDRLTAGELDGFTPGGFANVMDVV